MEVAQDVVLWWIVVFVVLDCKVLLFCFLLIIWFHWDQSLMEHVQCPWRHNNELEWSSKKTGAYCLHQHHQSDVDGGSKDLWNVGKLLPDYTALQLRRQPSSHSPPWQPQILLITLCLRNSSVHGDVTVNWWTGVEPQANINYSVFKKVVAGNTLWTACNITECNPCARGM
jgi:hypothetical protein